MRNDTSTNSPLRILFLGNANNPLLINLAIELKKLNSRMVIDIVSEIRANNIQAQSAFDTIFEVKGGTYFRRVPGLKTMWMIFKFRATLKKIASQYDFVHMFFMHIGYSKSLDLIGKIAPKFIVTVFGSELYRSKQVVLKQLHPMAQKADWITAANNVTLADFIREFEVDTARTSIVRFGLSPLKAIRAMRETTSAQHKIALGLPANSFVITCGYNASPGQQHEAIISSLQKIKERLPPNYVLIFPLGSGGTTHYRENITTCLDNSGLNSRLILKFLSEDDLAHLRIGTDVMIQVQKTDQLSGAMQEHLFAGNSVITGSWLPYEVFDKLGLKYWKVDSPEQIGEMALKVIAELDNDKQSTKMNAEKIWNLSSWDANAAKWANLYSG